MKKDLHGSGSKAATLMELSFLITKIQENLNKKLLSEQIHLLEEEKVIFEKIEKVTEMMSSFLISKNLNDAHKMNKVLNVIKENINNPQMIDWNDLL